MYTRGFSLGNKTFLGRFVLREKMDFTGKGKGGVADLFDLDAHLELILEAQRSVVVERAGHAWPAGVHTVGVHGGAEGSKHGVFSGLKIAKVFAEMYDSGEIRLMEFHPVFYREVSHGRRANRFAIRGQPSKFGPRTAPRRQGSSARTRKHIPWVGGPGIVTD